MKLVYFYFRKLNGDNYLLAKNRLKKLPEFLNKNKDLFNEYNIKYF